MKLKTSVLLICLALTQLALAQVDIKGVVRETKNKTALQSVSVWINHLKKGALTDSEGVFIFKNIPTGKITLQLSYMGYQKKDTLIDVTSLSDIQLNIELKEAKKELDEVVIVSSSRTNSRIEDLPTKVEVVGAEEVGEENQIKPGNLTGLLGDFAGIQVQQTNVATGNADMRIQGLPGEYTQLLRDGIPLFEGYSGSFSILQLPPLDLQQIELIKGASSTLYGGGAIAGMVNLVSKKPKLDLPERSFTLNRSTLQENNINTFLSARNKSVGYTFFAGGNLQKEVDVNKDGFSDVPNVKSVFVHPRFFIYANPKSTLILGYTLSYEDRKGGDMNVLNHQTDGSHQFFIQNKSLQHIADVTLEQKMNSNILFTAKASASFLNRDVITNVFGMKAGQTNWYSEGAFSQKSDYHNWVAGINFNGEDFKKKLPDSSLIPNETSNTIGLFVQDDWKFARDFTLQTGLRLDHHSLYGDFILPHLSLMYKMNQSITMRLGGGMGYKTPTLFSAEIDERDYHFLSGYKAGIQSEKSYGFNYDINYKTKMDEWNITFNQTFFYTQIRQPLLLDSISNKTTFLYYNAAQPLQTLGFETYVQAKLDELEIYFGYVYTDARRKYETGRPHLPLIAGNKLATLVSFELSDNFRAGLELSYTDKQYLDDGSATSPYVIGAAMIRYELKKISFVLNCENLFDYRQSKFNTVVNPPYNNPKFPEIWAPLEGRVLNLSMQIKF